MDKQEQKTASAEQEPVEVKAEESKKQVQSEQAENKENLTKNEIAGLNRRISELEKANKAKEEALKKAEREKMTDAERLKAEKDEWEHERATIKREKRELLVTKALVKAGLDPDKFSRRIVGDKEEDIIQDVQDLKDLLDSSSRDLADKKVKDTLKVDAPKKSSSIKKMTLDEIEKLPTRQERVKAYKENGYMK